MNILLEAYKRLGIKRRYKGPMATRTYQYPSYIRGQAE